MYTHSLPLMNSLHPHFDLFSTLIGTKPARALVQRFGSLSDLRRASEQELLTVPGIGLVGAGRIQAAFELSSRASREVLAEKPLLDTPERVADLLRDEVQGYTVEHFLVLYLNTRRRLIELATLAKGTMDSVLVHPREVFAIAVQLGCSAIVLAHNHSGSGDPTPSEADIKVTRDLIRAGQLLKIEVLDHSILGRRTTERMRDFTSLKELGYCFLA